MSASDSGFIEFAGTCTALACAWAKEILFYVVLAIVVNILITGGPRRLVSDAIVFLLHVPVMKQVASWFLKKELTGFLQQVGIETSGSIKSQIKPLPIKGN